MTLATHRLYGLLLESTEPLPGLPTVAQTGRPDVRFTPGTMPAWDGTAPFTMSHRSPELEGTEPVLVVEEAPERRIRLTYGEGIRFHLELAEGRVWASWRDPLTIEDAVTFLVGPVLGLYLRRLGRLALHASAVVSGGRAIALVGAAGRGKSTLAATLALRGAGLLSDDLLVLSEGDRGWVAQPGYPLIRLWEDSATMLLGAAHGLPALSPTWEKRALGALGGPLHFHDGPARLGGIVVLEGATDSPLVEQVTSARGAETLLGVIANTYGASLLDDRARAVEFAAIARLVAAIPVVRLVRPVAPRPSASAEAIEAWAATLVSPAE